MLGLSGSSTLPIASSSTLGGVKISATPSTSGIGINSSTGVISIDSTWAATKQDFFAQASLDSVNDVMHLNADAETLSLYAVHVTAPTPSAGDNSTDIATTAFVQGELGNLAGAMVFKGTIGAQAASPTVTSLPTNGYKAGWTYRVITAGTYASKTCEVGDLIIAINDGPSTGSSVIDADWTVAQNNIDGAVTSAASSSTAERVPVWSDTSGKVIDNPSDGAYIEFGPGGINLYAGTSNVVVTGTLMDNNYNPYLKLGDGFCSYSTDTATITSSTTQDPSTGLYGVWVNGYSTWGGNAIVDYGAYVTTQLGSTTYKEKVMTDVYFGTPTTASGTTTIPVFFAVAQLPAAGTTITCYVTTLSDYV